MGERNQHGAAPTGPEPSQVEPAHEKIGRLTRERDELATQAGAFAEEVDRVRVQIGTVQAENDRLTAALAESERKRVEEQAALAALYEWYDRDGSVGGANDVFSEHRALLAREEAEHGR